MNVLFDLDGTLTDPRAGISGCIKHALVGVGHPCPSDSDLERHIGRPLRESFTALFADNDPKKVSAAIELYRERFSSTGIFENTVYPGIHSAWVSLRDLGARLFVATSKPTIFAQQNGESALNQVHLQRMAPDRFSSQSRLTPMNQP